MLKCQMCRIWHNRAIPPELLVLKNNYKFMFIGLKETAVGEREFFWNYGQTSVIECFCS